MNALTSDAYATLMPICEQTTATGWVADFLTDGGCALLMSSSAEEYAARNIDRARRSNEGRTTFLTMRRDAEHLAGRPVTLAVDAEPTGVERLEHLLPPIPERDRLSAMSDEALAEAFHAYASAARDMGIGMFLGPVLDPPGSNEWLDGRIIAEDAEQILRIGLRFVESVQETGIHAMAKHFPGHADLTAHPVVNAVVLRASRDELEESIERFRTVVRAKLASVMLGPVLVEALDPDEPAGTSSVVVRELRENLGFAGIVVSDDLDAVSTMKGRSLGRWQWRA